MLKWAVEILNVEIWNENAIFKIEFALLNKAQEKVSFNLSFYAICKLMTKFLLSNQKCMDMPFYLQKLDHWY